MAYYSGVFLLDLMQFRLDTGGHISHLAAFFGFLYSITAKRDLSENVTGVISTNLVNKSSVTPFKKDAQNYGKPAEDTLRYDKDKASNRSMKS
jgi:hypothetical protein